MEGEGNRISVPTVTAGMPSFDARARGGMGFEPSPPVAAVLQGTDEAHSQDLGPHQHTVRMNVERAKLWKEEFDGLTIEREGDPDFSSAKQRLLKLLQTLPPVGMPAVRLEQSLVWLGFAFRGHTKRYMWQLTARYLVEDPK
ncbi:hypothetical protein FVE85_3418 [Porphyridium purpureum]|uniref:Uncharacterized protein n=1 Tax=Porphyridium purpureum TaxID=35688 RepID=A0A5J4YXJ1_PORPP|nr:hypothetical protein FVE85_3418 [Porphyridium purpureum]|eukprot:POR0192..scf227_4